MWAVTYYNIYNDEDGLDDNVLIAIIIRIRRLFWQDIKLIKQAYIL